MKHIHLFQHIGGGCEIKEDKNKGYQCDDNYECECGVKLKTFSSPEVHFTMPQYIAGKDEHDNMDCEVCKTSPSITECSTYCECKGGNWKCHKDDGDGKSPS